MGFYINSGIGYYEGDRISVEDKEVPQRLDQWSIWNGKNWAAKQPPEDFSSVDQFKALLNDPSVKEWLSSQIAKPNE